MCSVPHQHLYTLMLLCAMLTLAACNLVAVGNAPTPFVNPITVQFVQPANGASVREGDEVIITLVAQDATAQDDGGIAAGIARVDLAVDSLPYQTGQPEVSAAVPLFTVEMNWRAVGVGRHALTATAYRTDGTSSDSVTIQLEVVASS